MKKRLFLTVLLLLLLFTAFGCEKKKKFGTWDGNYVYMRNFRVKTDGTDREDYLSSFSDGKKEYPITEEDVLDLAFHDDMIIMIVNYSPSDDTPNDDADQTTSSGPTSALLLYNIKNKTSDFAFSVGASGEYCGSPSFRWFYDDYFVLSRRTDDKTFYTTVDYQGNVLCANDDIYENQVIGDHVFRVIDEQLAFCTLSDREYVYLFPTEQQSAYVRHMTGNVYYFNNILFDPVEKKYCAISLDDHYAIDALDSYFLTMNCENWPNYYSEIKLYRVNDDCSYTHELTFPYALHLYYRYYDHDEKYISFKCGTKTQNDPSQIYTYNKETKALYKGEATLKGDIKDQWGVTDGIRCGKYYYNTYCTRSSWGGFRSFAFVRYNTETRESVYMEVKELMFSTHSPLDNRMKFTVKEY